MTKNFRILVVDDDRATCAIVSKMFTERGYTVDTAEDAQTALGLLDQNTYGVAILDFKMPGMNGVELFEKIAEKHPNTVGIMLTGLATINTVFPAIGAGMQRVLAKPVNIHELVPLVEEVASGSAR